MKRKIWMGAPLITILFLLAPIGDTAPDFTVLDSNLSDFKSAFNADAGKVRLVMYVSPTCGGCLRGAKQTQKNVLAKIDNPDLVAYVIWVPKNGGSERYVKKALDLVTDARATQFWDESRAAINIYDEMFGIEGRPCAGVFMLHDAAAVWEGDSPPKPDFFEDAHANEFSRTAGSRYDASRMAERARQMLEEKD